MAIAPPVALAGVHYTHNLEGDAPERDEPNKKNKGKVAATTWTTNEPWGAQLD